MPHETPCPRGTLDPSQRAPRAQGQPDPSRCRPVPAAPVTGPVCCGVCGNGLALASSPCWRRAVMRKLPSGSATHIPPDNAPLRLAYSDSPHSTHRRAAAVDDGHRCARAAAPSPHRRGRTAAQPPRDDRARRGPHALEGRPPPGVAPRTSILPRMSPVVMAAPRPGSFV